MLMRFVRRSVCTLSLTLGFLVVTPGARGFGVGADHLVNYVPGTAPSFGYTDPNTALGDPERFSGEGFGFPSVVSVFSPAFGYDELVSVGEGGELVVEFDHAITNSPSHKFGVDFSIIGNGGFIDTDYPNGRIATPAQTFGFDQMRIALSEDGTHYVTLPGSYTEGMFPAQGYRDSGPFDSTPGLVPTDFSIPVNPALTLSDFDGRSLADVLAMYDGSGGGTPVDIGASGLSSVRFVKLFLPDDGNPDTDLNFEVESFAVVPEPASLVLFGGLGIARLAAWKRPRRLA